MINRRYSKIISNIPHPDSISLLKTLANQEAYAMQGQPPIIWDRAIDFQVFDPYGNIFLDFTSGVLIANCGHSHPHVQAAILQEVNKGLLTTYLFPNKPRINFVNKLLQHVPKGLDNVLLFCTGSEAIECSLKLSKTWGAKVGGTSKKVIVSFTHAFHGRTLGSQLAGGIPELKNWILPLDYSFIQIPFPDGVYSNDLSFDSFEFFLQRHNVTCEDVCAVLIESYQGGVVSFAPTSYMSLLRSWCDRYNVLLILDEVQSGFGRTGRWWGFEHYNIIPDIIVAGKGISSSLPLSAVIGRKELVKDFAPGTMSTTHSGNPVCCAAALANIEVIENEGLVENAAKLGNILSRELLKFYRTYNQYLRAINGKGLVFGLQISQKNSKLPNAEMAKRIVWKCVSEGLLLFSPVGPEGATIKINPPLTISEDALMEGLNIFEKSFCSIVNSL